MAQNLKPSLAAGLALLKGTSQPISLPDDDVLANVVITDKIVCYTGHMAIFASCKVLFVLPLCRYTPSCVPGELPCCQIFGIVARSSGQQHPESRYKLTSTISFLPP